MTSFAAVLQRLWNENAASGVVAASAVSWQFFAPFLGWLSDNFKGKVTNRGKKVTLNHLAKNISRVSCQNYLELCHVKIFISVDHPSRCGGRRLRLWRIARAWGARVKFAGRVHEGFLGRHLQETAAIHEFPPFHLNKREFLEKKAPKFFPLKQRTPSERIPLPSRISCFLLEGHSARPRWWNLGHGFYLRPFPNFAFNKKPYQTATFGRLRWSWWLWQRLKSFSIYPTGMSTVCGKWIINYNPYISRL